MPQECGKRGSGRTAEEAHGRVRRRSDGPGVVCGFHDRFGEHRVHDAQKKASDDDAGDQRRRRLDEQSRNQKVHGKQHERALHDRGARHPSRQGGRDPNARDRERNAPAEEGQADPHCPEPEREGREGQQDEEPDVVEQGSRCQHGKGGGAQRANRCRQRHGGSPLAGPANKHGDGDEGDRHQRHHAEERAAPADLAEKTAEERPDRDPQSEGGFVEDDRRAASASCRADDGRQGCRDE